MGAKISKGAKLKYWVLNFETYTRYSWVADEEQKKKGLWCVKGAIAFLLL